VTYAHNAFGQETQIADARGNTFNNAYDAVGNLPTVTDPLGNLAGQNINSQGLASLRRDAENNDTTFLSYTLHPSGRRTAITEANGRTSNYPHDDLYRLIGESINDPDNGTHTSSYQYDAVSNRIQATVNGVSTSYTRDDNDRLLANGADTYSYDSRNKLINAVMVGLSQAMAYDLDGARISIDCLNR